MAELRKFGMLLLPATSLAPCCAVSAQSPGKIEISKMNPSGLLVDKYSYMSQPYSYDGAFEAEGIYGQCIYVNPAKQVVIVQTSAWPEPVSSPLAQEQKQVLEKIAAELVLWQKRS
jgi:CubicO group peptidase (beta-lactamase class C family)